MYYLSTQWVHERATSCRLPMGTMLGYNNRQNVPSSVLTQLQCLAITVDVLPLPLTKWMDHRLVLLAPCRWS
jgi:hypothetical protein